MNNQTELGNKKNIVLVTWKGAGNFGTYLQSYALNKKLQDLGFNVGFLPYLPPSYSIRQQLKWLLSLFGIKKIRDVVMRFKLSKQERKNKLFQKCHYNNEITIYTKKQEIKLVNTTYCFVTGSDQIWNTYFKFDPTFFLSFVGEKKRVAYASSIGVNSVKEEYKDRVKDFLQKFNHIGVREKEAVKVLTELTGRNDIVQVVDPTFLLTSNEWKKMAEDGKYEVDLPKDYIFCYLIGNNSWYKEQLMDVKKRTGINHVIIIPSAESPDFTCEGATIYRNASPVEFIDILQNAMLVCTDSFHATALSINNSIPFVEFMRFQDCDKKSQNSRLYDLLEHYELMYRIYQKDSNQWSAPIDYQKVQEILDKDRKFSLDYLVNSIEK